MRAAIIVIPSLYLQQTNELGEEINHVRIPRWRKRRHRRAQEELHEGCATKMALPDQLRLLIDQDQGAAPLNGPNALEHLGGTGETRR